MRPILYSLSTSFSALVLAQFPTQPTYDQIVPGKLGDGFTVSLKENNVCETTPGVKSYSGYITTPPSNHSATTVNSFFWFFESRKGAANAPLAIFIGGGPGFNSISSAVNDLGPCWVNADSNSTTLNPWSFNNEANLLFIDQPSMVGYSYDERVNGILNEDTESGGLPIGLEIIPEENGALLQPNVTIAPGTFPSQNMNNTANSTSNAAEIFWEDAQTWFQAFPQYLPSQKKISLWTESYGGRYAPQFASLFYEKNKQIAAGQLRNAEVIEFDTIGIINGWLDPATHLKAYPEFAINNTYGVQMVNSTVLAAMQANLTAAGGCLDLVAQCQTAASTVDPLDTAANTTIDGICAEALSQCEAGVQGIPLAISGLTSDDITQPSPGSWQLPYYNGFFAQQWVQEALGAAVNFTDNSNPILAAFAGTGDFVRNGQLEHVGELLDAGVYIAIINGDRDYILNWLGGEAASLAVPWAGAEQFENAGYANLTVNETYVGGMSRQYSRLSFTRVYQAGHQGPLYQPETFYRLFDRTIKHLDLPDGRGSMELPGNMTLITQGPESIIDVRQLALPPKTPICYQFTASLTCTENQLKSIKSGKAVFKDWILQE